MRGDQRTGAERRVHLVAGEGDDIDAERGDVHGAVRHELRAVDDDEDAALTGGGGDGAQVGQPAGDVGAPVTASTRGRGLVEAASMAATSKVPRGRRPRPAAARAGPGQQVGVVLDRGGDDDVVLGEPEAERQQVQRLGVHVDRLDPLAGNHDFPALGMGVAVRPEPLPPPADALAPAVTAGMNSQPVKTISPLISASSPIGLPMPGQPRAADPTPGNR